MVDAGYVGHVAIEDEVGACLLGQRDGAAAEGFALVGEGEPGALAGQHPRDAPGDRALVGNPHDEATLACHQRPGAGNVRASHDLLPFVVRASRLGPTLDDDLPVRHCETPAPDARAARTRVPAPSCVASLQYQSRIGAAEAEAVRHDTVKVGIVLPL